MGVGVNQKSGARLMKLAHIKGVCRRRGHIVTTERDRHANSAPDLIKRQFVAATINQLWLTNMTYAPTWAGLLYSAVVIDVLGRKVVGWAFGLRMTNDLRPLHNPHFLN